MKEALYTLGNVIHVLQKERGCISIFLCSQGRLFSERMEIQFSDSDEILIDFTKLLEKWENSKSLDFKQLDKLKSLLDLYCELPSLRENIKNQDETLAKIINHYSNKLISPLLQIMVEIALYMEGHNPTFVSAYNAFLQWKERIGLERAIGAKGFVWHSFGNDEFLERILFLLSEQGNYRKTYMALANDAQKQLVQQVLNGNESAKLRKLHELLSSSPESKLLHDLTPQAWFDLVTAKIDALQNVEKKLIDSLSDKKDENTNNAPLNETKKNSFGEYDDLLNSLQLFSGLSSENLNSVLSSGQIREFHKGKLLFLEGEQANRFYIILKGWVKVFKGTSAGEETILQMLTSGDTIMESAVFLNTSFPVSAQIAQDATLLSIPAPVLREQVKANNHLALNLLSSMSSRSHGLVRQIEDARLKSADERIGWFLLRLFIEQGDTSLSIKLPYDKSLIASYLDMKRETFSRSLKRLKVKGFKIENDTIIIPALSSLCGFCDSNISIQCPIHNAAQCPNLDCNC